MSQVDSLLTIKELAEVKAPGTSVKRMIAILQDAIDRDDDWCIREEMARERELARVR